MNPESKRAIALEDLLRLKRAERPPSEFWTRFDRELRAKQLAALVAQRPWWQRLPRMFSGFSRYHVSLGTTAILAVTFISVRDHQSSSPAKVPESAAVKHTAHAAVSSVPNLVAPSNTQESLPSDLIAIEQRAASPATIVELAGAPAAAVTLANASDGISRPTNASLAGAFSGDTTGPELGSSPRYAAASLAGSEPVIARNLLRAATGFETRALPVRSTVEPLQQMTPPSERSRAKMLTAMVSRASSDTPARTPDRVVNRLSEERLYDQISRFRAHGTTVNMKF